ncbi:MAG: phosphotransferase [Acidimicrobiales bacterium]|nr:phosphotransferase [Acidimicrobiales bacterium]
MELTTDGGPLVGDGGRAEVGPGGVAARAVAESARAALVDDPILAEPPRPAVDGYGPGAFTCRLAGGGHGAWAAPVVVRVAPLPDLRRERAWHRFCGDHGCAVPDVVGLVESDRGDLGALVVAQGGSVSLMEQFGQNPTAIPVLLRWMAEVHARVHGLPAEAAPPGLASAPLDHLDQLLARTGLHGRFAEERAWLDAHAPPPAARPVVCHGDMQPASVRLEPDEPDRAQVVNWSAARVADAEYDVAVTLLMFWSVPYLAEGIGQRKMLKTLRDAITDGYRAAYEAVPGRRPLHDERLRYWGAFHALTWSVRLAAADAAGGPADPWDPVALVRHVASYRKDLGRRFARLARG